MMSSWQVWYSAAWSISAHRAFRDALTALLSPERRRLLPPPAVKLLLHWQIHDVPLAVARREWLASRNRSNTNIANLKHKADRIAMCQYLVSGELLRCVNICIPLDLKLNLRFTSSQFFMLMTLYKLFGCTALRSCAACVSHMSNVSSSSHCTSCRYLALGHTVWASF